MIVGIIARELYLLKYPVPARDSFVYYDLINNWDTIIKNQIQEERFPPLSIFLLKIPHTLFNYDIIKGAILINCTLGIAVIALIAKIAFLLTKRTIIAFSTGIVFGTHPTLIKYSCEALREKTYIFFLCLSLLYFLFYIRKEKLLMLLLATFFSCCATLCRYEGLEFLTVLFVYILFFKKTKTLQKKVALFALVVIGSMLSIFTIIKIINIPLDYFQITYSYIAEHLSF